MTSFLSQLYYKSKEVVDGFLNVQKKPHRFSFLLLFPTETHGIVALEETKNHEKTRGAIDTTVIRPSLSWSVEYNCICDDGDGSIILHRCRALEDGHRANMQANLTIVCPRLQCSTKDLFVDHRIGRDQVARAVEGAPVNGGSKHTNIHVAVDKI